MKGKNKNLMLHSYQIRFIIKDKRYTYTALTPDYFKTMFQDIEIIDFMQNSVHKSKRIICSNFSL